MCSSDLDRLSTEEKARITRNKIAEMDEKIGQFQEFKCHLVEKLKRLESMVEQGIKAECTEAIS